MSTAFLFFAYMLYFVESDIIMKEGSFPTKQFKLLTAWIALHEDELNANWILLSSGDGYFKIEPLH